MGLNVRQCKVYEKCPEHTGFLIEVYTLQVCFGVFLLCVWEVIDSEIAQGKSKGGDLDDHLSVTAAGSSDT